MTPTEIRAELKAIKALVPNASYASAHIYTFDDKDKPLSVSVSLRGKDSINVDGATWDEVFAALRAKIAAEAQSRRIERIRTLALAIIDMTQAKGTACDVDLRQRGFSDDELASMHEDAGTLAGEMASGAPFTVTFTAGSNGAPAVAAAE